MIAEKKQINFGYPESWQLKTIKIWPKLFRKYLINLATKVLYFGEAKILSIKCLILNPIWYCWIIYYPE